MKSVSTFVEREVISSLHFADMIINLFGRLIWCADGTSDRSFLWSKWFSIGQSNVRSSAIIQFQMGRISFPFLLHNHGILRSTVRNFISSQRKTKTKCGIALIDGLLIIYFPMTYAQKKKSTVDGRKCIKRQKSIPNRLGSMIDKSVRKMCMFWLCKQLLQANARMHTIRPSNGMSDNCRLKITYTCYALVIMRLSMHFIQRSFF